MSENYLVINGKKMDLTEEQLKQLGIKVRKNPFESVDYDKNYYYINSFGIARTTEKHVPISTDFQNVVNYFNDEDFAKQVALHQLLYRKLLKFAYDNECEDREWGIKHAHWHIFYDTSDDKFYVEPNDAFKHQGVYFSSRNGAERAVEEIIKPFMKEYPEFVW